MKKTFTLIISSLIAVSLMGQPEGKGLPGFKTLKKHAGIQDARKRRDNCIGIERHARIGYGLNQAHSNKSTWSIKQQLDSVIAEVWDDSASQWIGLFKSEYVYDPNGRNTLFTNHLWDETTSQWIFAYKNGYTYDAKGNNTLYMDYYWDETTNEWIVFGKGESTYDETGNINLDIYSYWDETASQWIAFDRDEFNYLPNGKIAFIIEYNWDEATSQWVEYYKYEFTYDENWNNVMDVEYRMDDIIGEWIVDYKEEYTYDTDGNNIMIISYEWDKTTSQWDQSYKLELTYNNSYSINDLILPVGSSFRNTYNHMQTNYTGYKFEDDNWVTFARGILFYSEQNSTGFSDLKTNIMVFPNPASKYVVFNFGDGYSKLALELIDMQGKTVKQQMITNEEQIVLQQLPKGLYSYKIYNNYKIIQTGKIMVE